ALGLDRMNWKSLARALAVAPILLASWLTCARATPESALALPAVLHAGDAIALHWDAAPSGVQEIELVLSVDGGRHFRLHVSPELDPATARYVWRVPNLDAGDAVLALRAGTPGHEAVWLTSGHFA